MSKLEPLKRCPFCGGEASCSPCDDSGEIAYAVACLSCLAQITKADEAAAIAQWNTRVSPNEVTGWLPIESAPKDGTEFLAWVHTAAGGRVTNVEWLKDKWVESYDLVGWNPEYGPTHWRPLPDPPALTAMGLTDIGG